MLLALAAPLPAVDFTVYTDKTAFLAAVSPGYYTETFNSLNGFYASPMTLRSGAEQFVAQATGGLYVGSVNSDQVLSTNNNGILDFTSFAGSPTAIGGYFFLTDSSFNVINGTINANLNSGAATFSVTTSSFTNFIGFVSTQNTPITLLSFGAPATIGGALSFNTANDLVVGQALAVPEPSTYALAAIATGVMAYLARRRKARTA
jgi:PEP-CTERM motif